MREIKFRAWDKKNKKIVEVIGTHLSCITNNIDLINVVDENENPNQLRGMNSFEIMQFTGLKDKNGKEIFEGDIVKYLSRVRYKNDNKCIEIGTIICMKDFSFKIDMLNYSYEDERFYSINQKNIEVIGNIYENPELLKGAEKI